MSINLASYRSSGTIGCPINGDVQIKRRIFNHHVWYASKHDLQATALILSTARTIDIR
jgi:hypothetical protein